MALQYYEDEVCIDKNVQSVECKISEVQSTKNKPTETIKNIEIQLGGHTNKITSYCNGK